MLYAAPVGGVEQDTIGLGRIGKRWRRLCEGVSAARTFAAKNGYALDPRQELLGIGAANLAAAAGHGYPVAGGLSQSAVNDKAGARTPLPDPEVHALIEREAARLRIRRRQIADEEIVDRCILPLVNEAARIVEEGIALRPGDVDVVWVNGYGFPRYRGGPMFYADENGLKDVLDRLKRLGSEHGSQYWTPASLLERLVEEGRSFRDLN